MFPSFGTPAQCPQCGRPARGDPSGLSGALCIACGYNFGAYGEDLSHEAEEVFEDLQRGHDRFMGRLFDHARKQLEPTSENPARSDVRNLLDWIDPRRRSEPDPMVKLLAVSLVVKTTRDQKLRRPRIDPALDRDAEAWAGGSEETPASLGDIFDHQLTPVLVIDFIAECERLLSDLSPEDRQLLEWRLGGDEGEEIAKEPLADVRADGVILRIVKEYQGRGP